MIRNNIFIFPLIVFAVILQVSSFPLLFPQNQVPSLILAGAAAALIIWGFNKVFVWIIISGIILDLVSGGIFGKTPIILSVTAYGMSFVSKRFVFESRGWGIFFIGLIFFAMAFVLKFMVFAADGNLEIMKNFIFFLNILKSAAYNLLVFIPVFYGFKKIDSILMKKSSLNLIF